MRFRNILLPVNGSAASLKAAEFALAHAGEDQASYVLLNVYDPVPLLIGGQARDQVDQEISVEEDAVMLPFRTMFRAASMNFRERLEEGHPVQAILAVAEEEGCDLILLGTRGRSDLAGLLLGSVSHGVQHGAHCPVLLIR